MAHFLEHLVFKGGEKYDDYRKVNETAERMGAVLNAYTSHDLVAFHITCRAEVVGEAIDLLTDFVGRPKIDAEELDRERGVVIQEIARANDQPSVVAEHLIDRAAFGDHPLGRPVLGPEEHLRTLHARGDRRLPLAPVGGRARRRVPGRQPRARARRRASWPRRSAASRRSRPNGGFEPAPAFSPQTLVEERDSNQSHLRISYRPQIDPRDPRAARRAGGLLDAAGRLDGLAPVRRDPRAARPRLLGLLGRPLVRRRADPAAVGRARVGQVRRGLHAHARDRRRAARRTGRREEEFERARAYAAGRRVLAFENTNAVARHAAGADRRLRRRTSTRTSAIAALDETTLERVGRGRARHLGRGVGGLRRAARGRRVRSNSPGDAHTRGSRGRVPGYVIRFACWGRPARLLLVLRQPGRGAQAATHAPSPQAEGRQGPAARASTTSTAHLQTTTTGGHQAADDRPAARADRRAGGRRRVPRHAPAARCASGHRNTLSVAAGRPDRRAARCCRRCSTTSRRSRR